MMALAEHRTPTLTTPRLVLRPVMESDAYALWVTIGRRDVMQHYPDLIDQTQGWSLERVVDAISGWRESDLPAWVITTQDTRVIGFINLTYLDYLTGIVSGTVEISHYIHPDFWGQRIVPEAMAEVLKYAFTDLQLDLVVACVEKENKKSVKAVKRYGLKYWKTRPYTSPESGRDAKFDVYRMTAEEFSRRTTDSE